MNPEIFKGNNDKDKNYDDPIQLDQEYSDAVVRDAEKDPEAFSEAIKDMEESGVDPDIIKELEKHRHGKDRE